MKKVYPLNWALDQELNSSSAKLVLVVMARRGNFSRVCFMSQGQIAKEACCSISTVGRHIRELKKLGFIREITVPNRMRCTRHYQFCLVGSDYGQNTIDHKSNCPASAGQNDRQNSYEVKTKTESTEKQAVYNECINVETPIERAPKRRGGVHELKHLVPPLLRNILS